MHVLIAVIVLCLSGFIVQPAAAQALPGTPLYEGLRLLEADDPESAIPYLKAAMSRDSLAIRAWVALGRAWLQTGKPDSAERYITEGRVLFPNNLPLLQMQAEAVSLPGRFKEAENLYRLLIEKMKNEGAGNETLDKLQIRLGRLYTVAGAQAHQSQQLNEAKSWFDKALHIFPDSAFAYYNLAIVRQQLGQTSQALELTSWGLGKRPADASLRRLHAWLLLQEDQPEAALSEFAALHQLNQTDVDISMVYAELLLRQRKPKEAQQVVEILLQAHENDPAVYERVIGLNRQFNNLPGVLNLLLRMRRQFPEDTELLIRIAETHEQLAQWDQARAWYDTLAAVSLRPLDAQRRKAATFVAQDSLQEAYVMYAELLKEPNPDAILLKEAALLYERVEKWNEAARALEQLAKKEKGEDVAIRLGVTQYKAGNFKDARKQLEKLVSDGTLRPEPWYYLALYKTEGKNLPEGCEMMKTAIRRALENSEALQEQLLSGLQQRNELAALDPQQQERGKQLKNLDELTVQAFDFYSSRCPPNQVHRFFEEITGTYHTSGRLHQLVGDYFAGQNQTGKARRHLQHSVRLSPDLAEAHRSLALIYEEQQAYSKALREWERYHSLNSGKESYSKLIRLHRFEGSLDVLIDRWQIRFQLAPDDSLLKIHLIEALHLAGRYTEAEELLREEEE